MPHGLASDVLSTVALGGPGGEAGAGDEVSPLPQAARNAAATRFAARTSCRPDYEEARGVFDQAQLDRWNPTSLADSPPAPGNPARTDLDGDFTHDDNLREQPELRFRREVDIHQTRDDQAPQRIRRRAQGRYHRMY